MTGSIFDYDQLAAAHIAHTTAERLFDLEPTTQHAKAADQTYIRMVNAATKCDPACLRSASISVWVVRRLETYRRLLNDIPAPQMFGGRSLDHTRQVHAHVESTLRGLT